TSSAGDAHSVPPCVSNRLSCGGCRPGLHGCVTEQRENTRARLLAFSGDNKLMPTTIADLDTPAVVIDLDIVEANIKRAQDTLACHGLNNRPHIKTHKIPALAKLQMEAGAVGITCQKLGEVEVMTDAGVADDILLTYNVLGDSK